MLDECRYTSSGIVAGRKLTGGEGIEEPDERPEIFPSSINGACRTATFTPPSFSNAPSYILTVSTLFG